MSATIGTWETPVTSTIPTQTIAYPNPADPTKNLTIPDPRDLFVIHAALLHTGKVLWFSGHAEAMHYAPVSFVWDPASGSLTKVPFPGAMDLFCCHFVQLEDGRILTVGGSDPDFNSHGSVGAKNIVIFDPMPSSGAPAGRWIDTGKQLNKGRWYPTAVVHGDGQVLVFSGRLDRTAFQAAPVASAGIAPTVEIIDPPDFTPKEVSGGDFLLPLYPGLHLGHDGRIYYTHTNWGQQIVEPTSRAFALTGATSAGIPTGLWRDFGTLAGEPRRREEGMSVLLAPAHEGKVLVVGGSEARTPAGTPILRGGLGPREPIVNVADPGDPKRANILTINGGATPSWSPAPGGGATGHARINGHLVLLPDATVLVCGGHDRYKWHGFASTNPSYATEIFTPDWTASIWPPASGFHAAGFRDVATMALARMYHSTALLLPDGRVVVAGGADPNGENIVPGGPDTFEPVLPWPAGWPADLRWGSTLPLNRKDREIYKPPYMFKPGRPKIKAVRAGGTAISQIAYGGTFEIELKSAATIRVVALMRPGCPTHHTDTEQRFVNLAFTQAGLILTVTMVAETQKSLAPPGYYMLWIIDDQQRPCIEAKWLQVLRSRIPVLDPPPSPPPPAPVIDEPLVPVCIVATAAAGSADAEEVVTLQAARARLARETKAGRRFIAGVNRAYYSFSPGLAAYIAPRARLRRAVRSIVTRPAARIVSSVVAGGERIAPVQARATVVITAYLTVAMIMLLLSPLVLLAVGLHLAVQFFAGIAPGRGGSDDG